MRSCERMKCHPEYAAGSTKDLLQHRMMPDFLVLSPTAQAARMLPLPRSADAAEVSPVFVRLPVQHNPGQLQV